VFELREGVTFHDGTTLSVADVAASFALVQNVVGPLRGEFDDLESVTITGPQTIAFRFSESRPERADAFASVPIVSAKSFQGADVTTLNLHTASQNPNGTGPLQLQRTSVDEIALVRNQSYWGPPAKARRIVYRVIADRTRALNELRSGQLDVVLGLPVDEAVAAVKGDASLELIQRSLPAYTAAVFNTENTRLHRGARSALSRSFDRESILQELFRGYAEVAIGPFLRHGAREAPAGVGSEFVLEAAVEDLRAAFSDATPKLQLLVPRGSRTMERLADIWASDVRGAVDIDVQQVEFGALLARVRSGDFEMALLSFTTSADTDLFSLFHSSEVGRGNLSRLAEPAVDALLETLRRSLAEEERIETSHALQHQLLRLAPYAFLTTDVRLGIVRKDVAGVGDTAPAEGARFYGRLAKATP
jgi:peptide/nickel transport system substrate-binding protein